MQTSLHYNSLITGAVAPGPLVVPFVAALGQRLGKRVSPSNLVALGNAFIGVAAALMAVSASIEVNWTQILPGWLLVGVGVGLLATLSSFGIAATARAVKQIRR